MAHLCLLSFNKKILNAFLGFFLISVSSSLTHVIWKCGINSEVLMLFYWVKKPKLLVITADSSSLYGTEPVPYKKKQLAASFCGWLILVLLLEENEPKFHKLDSVYIYMWKYMSKGSWNSRKFNEKWLSHICELKAQLELPSEALWKGSSGSHILNLETGLLEFRNVCSLCFVCVQFCMSLKVSHRGRSVK